MGKSFFVNSENLPGPLRLRLERRRAEIGIYALLIEHEPEREVAGIMPNDEKQSRYGNVRRR